MFDFFSVYVCDGVYISATERIAMKPYLLRCQQVLVLHLNILLIICLSWSEYITL